MNAYINYLIEANLGLTFFMLIYWTGLRKENQFSFQRIYLLTALLASAVFPLIHLDLQSQAIIPALGNSLPSSWLPEMVISPNDNTVIRDTIQTSSWSYMEWTYLLVSVVLLVIFLYQLSKILKLFLVSKKYYWNHCIVIESNENKPTFSFFGFIFIGQADSLSPEEKEAVRYHESIHADRIHSFDVVLVNAMTILFWFNPFIWMYKSTLSHIHEFEADALSTQNKNVDVYCELLTKVTLQSAGFHMVNHFNGSLTMERIAMMRAIKQKIKGWKITAIAMTIPLFFIAVACQDQVKDSLSSGTSTLEANYPAAVKTKLGQLRERFPDKDFVYMEGVEKADKFIQSEGYHIWMVNVSKMKDGSQIVGIILGNKAPDESNNKPSTSDPVFDIVEENATPVGGIKSFYQNATQQLHYPASGIAAGIEGRVFVEFIVNEDGKLSDFRVVRSDFIVSSGDKKILATVGPEFNDEVIRIMSLSQAWNPAKQRNIPVKQRYTLPITFSLENGTPTVTSSEETNQSEKLKMNVTYDKSFIHGEYHWIGKITAQDGSPLPGVNIVLKNSSDGTYSDSEGSFQFKTNQKESLILSFVGFKSKLIE